MLDETQLSAILAARGHKLTRPRRAVLTVIAAVSERGLYFSPAEIGFLFPAPVGRRELLLYNLVTRLGVQVLSGISAGERLAAGDLTKLSDGATVKITQ